MEDGLSPGVQLCMTDVVFSTRLWTKLPTRIGSAPRRQILAKAVSYLRPNKQLRESFLDQLEKLKKQGIVSDNEATYLRLTSFADQILALEYDGRVHAISRSEAEEVVQDALRSFNRLVESKAAEMARNSADEEIRRIKDETQRELRQLRDDAAALAAEKEANGERSLEMRRKLDRLEAGERVAVGRINRKADALIRLQLISRYAMFALLTVVAFVEYIQASDPTSKLTKSLGPALAALLAVATLGSFFPRQLFSSLYASITGMVARHTK